MLSAQVFRGVRYSAIQLSLILVGLLIVVGVAIPPIQIAPLAIPASQLPADPSPYAVIQAGASTLSAVNPAHQLDATFTRQGLHLTAPAGSVEMKLVAYGYETAPRPVLGWARPEAVGSRVEYRRGGLTEWYANSAAGLEHGFTLDAPPGAGEGDLVFKLALETDFVPRMVGDSLLFIHDDSALLSYAGLIVWDATGRELPASMVLDGQHVIIRVNDVEAVYPILIDPSYTEELLIAGPGNDWLGTQNLAMDGTTLVAKQVNDEIRVYVRGASWGLQQALTTPAAAGFDYGQDFDVSGDVLAIGDPSAGSPAKGEVFVFTRSGGVWSQTGNFTTTDGGSSAIRFGQSVAISGSTMVVGATDADSSIGAAYVFTLSGGLWTQQAKLTTLTHSRLTFGSSVAINGNTIAVADAAADRVTVFTGSGASWTEQADLTATGLRGTGASGDQYVSVVAISGDTLVADTSDDVAVFTRSGSTWSAPTTLTPSIALGSFGESVDIDGGTIVVGASTSGSDGRAFVFAGSGSSWTETDILQRAAGTCGSPFGSNGCRLGETVAISGGLIATGAPDYDCCQSGGSAPGALVFWSQLTADLSLTKGASSATPNYGTNVTFTLTLNNAGPGSPAVTVTDVLPAGLTYVSSTPSQGTYSNVTGVWNVGVASPGSATLSITATVNSASAMTNTAQVTASNLPDPDSTPGDNTGDDYATVTITPVSADVGVTIVDTTDPVQTLEPIQYTVTVTNAGPSTASSVQVGGNLTGSGTIQNVVATGGGTCVFTTTTYSCTWASLASGANQTITVDGVASATSGTATLNAAVTTTTPDANTVNDSATQSTIVGTAAIVPDSYEENDTQPFAKQVSANTTLNLTIAPSLDDDWFYFLLQPGPFSASALSSFGVNLVLELYSSTDLVNPIKTSSSSINPSISATIPKQGYYILAVKPQNAGLAVYQLTLSNQQPTPAPTPTPVPTYDPGDIDIAEYNNDFGSAFRLAPGNTISLNFNSGIPGVTDVDYFVMTVKAGVVYTCETYDLGLGADTILSIYGPTASENNLIGINDDISTTTGNVASKVTWTSEYDGQVYVLVQQNGPVSDPESATYNLTCYVGTTRGGTGTPVPGGGSGTNGGSNITVQIVGAPTDVPTPESPELGVLTLKLLIAYDENANGLVDLSEGVVGMSVRALDPSINRQIASGFTDQFGSLQLIFTAPQDTEVLIVIPFLSLGRTFRVGNTAEWRVLLPSSNLPGLIP